MENRRIVDASKEVYAALPAAAAAVNSAVIDLGEGPGLLDSVELEIGHEALPSLVDAKTVILSVQDSDDDVTYATNADYPTLTTTGDGGDGAGVGQKFVKIPRSAKRYAKIRATVLAAGGDNTAKKFYGRLVF